MELGFKWQSLPIFQWKILSCLGTVPYIISYLWRMIEIWDLLLEWKVLRVGAASSSYKKMYNNFNDFMFVYMFLFCNILSKYWKGKARGFYSPHLLFWLPFYYNIGEGWSDDGKCLVMGKHDLWQYLFLLLVFMCTYVFKQLL